MPLHRGLSVPNTGALSPGLRPLSHGSLTGPLTTDQLEPIDKGNYLLSPNAHETQATPANGVRLGSHASHLRQCSPQRRPGTKAGAARVCAHVTRGRHKYAPGISTIDRTRLTVVSCCRKDRRAIGHASDHTTAHDTAASMAAHSQSHQPPPVPAQRPGTHARPLSSPLAHSTALPAFLTVACRPPTHSAFSPTSCKYPTSVRYLVRLAATSHNPAFLGAITCSACGGPSL